MDVVPDGDFLSEFIDSLGKEEEEVEDERAQSSSSSIPPAPITHEEIKESDVWVDIEEALHIWTTRILDTETRLEKTISYRENIEASLRRQQLDGFLDHHDVAELRHVADLWAHLLNASSCYTIGCVFLKRDIITLLLELYTLKQINNNMFIEACLQL